MEIPEVEIQEVAPKIERKNAELLKERGGVNEKSGKFLKILEGCYKINLESIQGVDSKKL